MNNIVPIWQELIVVFGGNAVLLAVLGFLFKSLLSHMLTKDVEKFKTELRADADISIERLKNTLQMAALEHQVRFSNLHEHQVRFSNLREKRAEVLSEIYRRLVESFLEAQRYVYQLGMRGNEELYIAVEKRIFSFSEFIEINRIYLSEEVCDLLRKFTNALRGPVIDIWVYGGVDAQTPETINERAKAFKAALKSFSGDINKARGIIEAEFRRILEGTPQAS